MSKSLCAIFVALFGLLASTWASHAEHCSFREAGFGYTAVRDNDAVWTYELRLRSGHRRWDQTPLGWHATGQLSCRECEFNGLYGLVARADIERIGYPKTLGQRTALPVEHIGYPALALKRDELTLRNSKDGISHGPFRGYWILYDLIASKYGQMQLFIVSLSDGCVMFNVSMWGNLKMHPDDLMHTLLDEIEIARIAGLVRPHAQGQEQFKTDRGK